MIDVRGRSCPIPVVMVQNAAKADPSAALEILADQPVSVENISRFGRNHGYTVSVCPEGTDWRITLKKD